MQFTALHLKNLGVHRALDLEFRPGINGVVGPNGSGKSQILDGLRFAITGEVAAQGNINENITTGEPSALVVADFIHGDGQYKIERSMGKGRTPPILHMPDKQVRGAAEVERELTKLLGTTMEAMLNNVFVPQGAIDSILFSTNTERLREIQQTVGLHRCADAEKALTIELGRYNVTVGLKEQLEMLTTQSQDAQRESDITQAALESLGPQIEQLWQYAEQLQRWLADKVLFEQLAQVTQRLERVQLEHQDTERQYQQALNIHTELSKRLEALRPSAERARADLLAWQTGQRTRQLREQLISQQQALAAALAVQPSIDQAAIEKAELRARQLQARLVNYEGQLVGRTPRAQLPEELELEHDLQAVRAELRARPARRPIGEAEQLLGLRIKDMQAAIQTFSTGSCPTCGQPVKDHDPGRMQAELRGMANQMTELVNAETLLFNAQGTELRTKEEDLVISLKQMQEIFLNMIRSELETLRPTVTAAETEAQSMRKMAQIYAQQVSRQADLDIQLARLGDDQTASLSGEQLQAEVKMADDLFAQLADTTTALKLCEQALKTAQAALEQAQVDRQALKAISQAPTDQQVEEAKVKVEELKGKQIEQRRLGEQLAQQQVRATQLADTCLRLRKQLEIEAKDTAWTTVCRRARDVLHVNGLPTLLMKEYAKILNKRIAYYLNVWEAPFTLRLDDELAFVADFPDGRSHAAARLSGGQKIVASTSFRLAMTDTFAKQVGLLVLDEPSNYLDKDNLVHLQTLLLKLKEMAGQSGRQIILVTHEEQLTGFFDHHISVYH